MHKIYSGITRNRIVLILFACLALNMAAPPPPYMWANTGAPGEETCYSCHVEFPLNDTGGFLKINTIPPLHNGLYVPGQTYLVTETFTRPPLISYTCSTEIVDSLGNDAGVKAISDSLNTSLVSTPSGRFCVWARYYDVDTSIQCNFIWTAPASGPVSIYAAGVTHSFQLGGSGGYVYTDSLVNLQPDYSNSVAETDKATGFELYPNPTGAEMTIGFKVAKPTDYELIVYSTAGQKMMQQNGRTSTGDYKQQLTLTTLPKGVYLVCLQVDKAKFSRKVVVE